MTTTRTLPAPRRATGSPAADRPADRAAGDLAGLADRIDGAIGRADTRAARGLVAEAIRLSRAVGDLAAEADAVHRAGHVELLDGRPAEAARHFADALARRHELRLHDEVATSLECVAQVVAAADGVLAAELLGAAEVVRDRHGLPVPPSLAYTRSAAGDGARAELGDRGFTRAHVVGRTRALDVMVHRARTAAAALH